MADEGEFDNEEGNAPSHEGAKRRNTLEEQGGGVGNKEEYKHRVRRHSSRRRGN